MSNLKHRLPFELYRNIVNEVDKKSDLVSLLLVSQAFYAEAERTLYREVDIIDDDDRLLKQITSSTRIARHVTSLAVLDCNEVELGLLNSVLRSVVNLVSLALYTTHWIEFDQLVHGVSFRLDTLTVGILALDLSSKAFFRSQSSFLRELYFTGDATIHTEMIEALNRIRFPNLRKFKSWIIEDDEMPPPTELLRLKSLERLACQQDIIETIDRPLSSIRALYVFDWQRYYNRGIQHFPNLTYLRLTVVSITSASHLRGIFPLTHDEIIALF